MGVLMTTSRQLSGTKKVVNKTVPMTIRPVYILTVSFMANSFYTAKLWLPITVLTVRVRIHWSPVALGL